MIEWASRKLCCKIFVFRTLWQLNKSDDGDRLRFLFLIWFSLTLKIKSFRPLKSMKEEGSPSSTNPSCNVLRIQTQIIALISNPKANKSNSMHATLYLMEHQVSLASGVRKGWLFRWPWWKLWRTWRLQLTIESSSSHWERRTKRKKRKTNACRL